MRFVATATLLTIAPLTITPATAQVASPLAPMLEATILDVSSTGKTTRVPDVATIRAGVVTQNISAAQALADNARRMSGVLAALKAAGVEPRDITTSSVSLAPQYRYQNNLPPEITGYQASNTVSVRFRQIAASGAILDTLVKQGANQIEGPSLTIDKPDAALDEARRGAISQARARAELYAAAAGLHVVRMLTISEGSLNGGSPPPPLYAMRAAVAKEADTTIAAGETELSVTISVRFLLK